MTTTPDTTAARAAVEAAFGHDPHTNDCSDLIDMLNLNRLIDDNGNVDPVKVERLADIHFPDREPTPRRDYGQGFRGPTYGSGSVTAFMQEQQDLRAAKTTD